MGSIIYIPYHGHIIFAKRGQAGEALMWIQHVFNMCCPSEMSSLLLLILLQQTHSWLLRWWSFVITYTVHHVDGIIILSSTIQIMNVNKQPAVHCIVAALFEISVLMRNILSVHLLRSKLNNNLMNSQGSFNSQGTDLCLDFRVHCRLQCDKSCLSVRDFSIIGIVIQSGS